MWIIKFMPEWAFHMLFFAGLLATIAGFALGMLPFIKKYALALKLFGFTALSLALYLEGGLADYKEWELRVKEMEAKVAKAEAESAKKNIEIIEKIVYKDKIIKQNAVTVKQYIDREIVKYDETCKIPAEVIKAHNAAAKNEGIEEKK
jgi:hypothetical protein